MPFRGIRHTPTVLCLVALIIACGDDNVTDPPPVQTGYLAVTTASIIQSA